MVSPSTPCRQTVRIQLPTRPLPDPPLAHDSPSPVRATVAAVMPDQITTQSPKRETARIGALPGPPLKPAMEMRKNRPLIDSPKVEASMTKGTVAPGPGPLPQPAPQIRADDLPVSLCWGLLGTSAAILILQIWNYLA